MKRLLKLIIFVFVSFFTFSTCIFGLSLNSEKYILYNLDTDEVLLKKDSDVKASIASLTKIMSVIVAIENIDDYDKVITITSDMLNGIAYDVAVTGFKVGDKVTVDDLLYSAIVASGADSVNALAYVVSGSTSKFVKLMNDKSKELNMKNTNFTNVVGLYDSKHYSTCEDMGILVKYALKNKKFREIFGANYYNTSNGIKLRSTISRYNDGKNNISYITGAKTGYLSKAGNCLASTAHISGIDYLLITINSYKGKTSHVDDAVKVYNYYGNLYEKANVVLKNDEIVKIKVKYTKEKYIMIKANQNIDVIMKKGFDKSKVSYDYDGKDVVTYFTKNGIKLGNVKVKYNGEVISNFDLYYNEKDNVHFSLMSFIFSYSYVIIIIVLIICFKKRSKKKRRKK